MNNVAAEEAKENTTGWARQRAQGVQSAGGALWGPVRACSVGGGGVRLASAEVSQVPHADHAIPCAAAGQEPPRECS